MTWRGSTSAARRRHRVVPNETSGTSSAGWPTTATALPSAPRVGSRCRGSRCRRRCSLLPGTTPTSCWVCSTSCCRCSARSGSTSAATSPSSSARAPAPRTSPRGEGPRVPRPRAPTGRAAPGAGLRGAAVGRRAATAPGAGELAARGRRAGGVVLRGAAARRRSGSAPRRGGPARPAGHRRRRLLRLRRQPRPDRRDRPPVLGGAGHLEVLAGGAHRQRPRQRRRRRRGRAPPAKVCWSPTGATTATTNRSR